MCFNNPAKQKVDLTKLMKEESGMQKVKPTDTNIKEMNQKMKQIAKEKNDRAKVQEARRKMDIGSEVYYIEQNFICKGTILGIGEDTIMLDDAFSSYTHLKTTDVYFSVREALDALEEL